MLPSPPCMAVRPMTGTVPDCEVRESVIKRESVTGNWGAKREEWRDEEEGVKVRMKTNEDWRGRAKELTTLEGKVNKVKTGS